MFTHKFYIDTSLYTGNCYVDTLVYLDHCYNDSTTFTYLHTKGLFNTFEKQCINLDLCVLRLIS